MTHVAASIGFSWEPYVMSLSADTQKWVNEYLALRHTLLFVLGMFVFRIFSLRLLNAMGVDAMRQNSNTD